MKVNQKIRRIGGSLGILLPMIFIKSKELKEGDFVEVDLNHIKRVKSRKGGKRK